MQLKTLRLFCAVANLRSFSRAAEQYDVSQSLVSQTVNSLEKRLGTKLVDRSKRPLQLTTNGAAYFEGCRRLLEDFDRLEDSVLRQTDTVVGTVRVASIYSVGLLEMGRYVADFRKEYPDVFVRMDYLRPEQVYERLLSDEADIGVVSFPQKGGEFRSTMWQEQEFVLIVPPNHPFAGRKAVSVPQLNELDFVAFTADLKIRRQIDRWLREAGVTVSVVYEFDNTENIKRAVEIGSGAALLPLPTVVRECEYGTLKTVAIRGAKWTRPLGIVRKRNRQLALPATRFVEFLMARKPGVLKSSHHARAASAS